MQTDVIEPECVVVPARRRDAAEICTTEWHAHGWSGDDRAAVVRIACSFASESQLGQRNPGRHVRHWWRRGQHIWPCVCLMRPPRRRHARAGFKTSIDPARMRQRRRQQRSRHPPSDVRCTSSSWQPPADRSPQVLHRIGDVHRHSLVFSLCLSERAPPQPWPRGSNGFL